MTPPLILCHASCPDGVGAAWLLRMTIGAAEVIQVSYDDAELPDVTDRVVWIVDFCYPGEQLDEIARRAESLVIFDHHQTALGYVNDSEEVTLFSAMRDWLDAESPSRAAVIDMDHSGIGLVAEYRDLAFDLDSPPFAKHVEDRDLWRFRLRDTPAIFAAITSRPYTMEAWDEIYRVGYRGLLTEGQAIERYRQQLIEATLETAYQDTVIGHRDIWVAACPYAIGSDVAGELAKRDPSRFAAYFVECGNFRRYGLRSTDSGLDVAELAATVGGGGHKHASGFRWTPA